MNLTFGRPSVIGGTEKRSTSSIKFETDIKKTSDAFNITSIRKKILSHNDIHFI